ncbi:hypothetical protein F8388_017660 [Cannabis sativa]|uniref:F-box associated beta-propeller type 3 domain-containing protein n=1 Tax=Cannabis sativa TaxID=3483 RepID=A0A7J6DW59_CANSA|nr:hypothetical protein F8388_017660 [Cannabis sativa]KAF4393258.1 hypothetical protein G4B88_001992 [Cannabis sativa]
MASVDIHSDILKDLVRYRSVCKEWRTLIDAPHFIKMQLKSSKQGLFIFINNEKNQQKDMYWLDLTNQGCSIEKIRSSIPPFGTPSGCYNGLIITQDRPSIYNPFTKNHTPLSHYSYRLSPYAKVIGLGYDPLIDDYKVVAHTRFDSIRQNYVSKYHLYYVKAQTLKRLNCHDAFLENYGYELSNCAFVDNCLYWIVVKSESSGMNLIFAFDLKTEKHNTLSLPFQSKGNAFRAVEFEGSVCVIKPIYRDIGPLLDYEIWVMKDHDKENSSCNWSMLFSVVSGVFGSNLSVVPLKYYNTTNDQIFLMLDFHKLVVYDLKTNTVIKIVRFHDLMAKSGNSLSVFMGVQSLIGF